MLFKERDTLYRAKRLHKRAHITDLIIKDEPFRVPDNKTITEVLLSQYATALSDESLINFNNESLDDKNQLPHSILFAFLEKCLINGRLAQATNLLNTHIGRKRSQKAHILMYNVSKINQLLGQNQKAVFFLQSLLKYQPFFSEAVYDIALSYATIYNRTHEALTFLQRHLSSLNSHNSYIHSAFIFCAHASPLTLQEISRILNNQKFSLINYFNLALLHKKRGELDRAQHLFAQLIHKLQTFVVHHSNQTRVKDSELLILSKLNLLSIKKQLGKNSEAATLGKSLLSNYSHSLDLLTKSQLQASLLETCPNTSRTFRFPQSNYRNKQKVAKSNQKVAIISVFPSTDINNSEIQQCNDSFDSLLSSLKSNHYCKLKNLLRKQKTINQFFKNLIVKRQNSSNSLRIILKNSVLSAKNELLSNSPSGLFSFQQNLLFQRQLDEQNIFHQSQFNPIEIQQVIKNILFNLKSVYMKKSPKNLKENISIKHTKKNFTLKAAKTDQQNDFIKRPTLQNLPYKNLISERSINNFRIKEQSRLQSQAKSRIEKVKPSFKRSHSFKKKQSLSQLFYKNQQQSPKINPKLLMTEQQQSSIPLLQNSNFSSYVQTIIEPQQQIADICNKIIEASPQITNIYNEIIEPSPQITNICNEILEPSAQITDIYNKIIEPQLQITESCNEIIEPSPQITNICIKIIEPQQQITEICNKIIEPSPQITGIYYEIIEPSPQITDIYYQIIEPQLQITETCNEIIEPSPQITNIYNEIIEASPQITNICNELIEPSPQITNICNEIIEPSRQITNICNKIIEPQQQIAEICNKIQITKQPEQKFLIVPESQDDRSNIRSNDPQQKQENKKKQSLNATDLNKSYFDRRSSAFNLTSFPQPQINNFAEKQSSYLPPDSVQLNSSSLKPLSSQFRLKMAKIYDLQNQLQLDEAYNKLIQLYKEYKGEAQKLQIMLRIGSLFEKQQKFSEAEKTFLKCTRLNSAQGFLCLGSLQLKLGKIQEGVQNLQKANCIKRFDINIQNRLVYGYSMKEETMEKALTLAHNILRKQPNSLQTLLMTAGILQKQGLVQEAIQIVTAIDQQGTTQYIKHYLGILHLQASNLREAFNCFKSSLTLKPDYVPSLIQMASIISDSFPKQSIAILNKALQLDPGNRKTLARLGKIYQADSDFENAMNTYKTALEAQENYESYMKIGDCLSKKESYIEALLNYKEALNLKQTPEAFEKMALMLELKGQFSKAIENYQSSITLIGQSLGQSDAKRKHLLAIGRLHLKLGQYDSAITVIQEILDFQQSFDLFKLLGLAYFGSKQYSISLDYYQKANALVNGQDIQTLESLAICLDRMEEYLASKAIYEKVLQKDPNNIRCLNNLANILLITGQTNEAFYLFQSMLQKFPNNVEKRLKVADIYAEVGDWSKVEYHLLQCYRQKEHDPRILQKLVTLYKEKRDHKMAAKYDKKLSLLKANHKTKIG